MEGSRTGLALADARAALAAARTALVGLADVLWQAQSGDLGSLLGEVDALVLAGELARVVVTAEAIERGETGAGPAALTPTGWVLAHAPGLRAGGAKSVVTMAAELAKPANALVRTACEEGALPLRSAAAVIAEADRLRPFLADDADLPVLEGLIALAVQDGPRGCRRLRPALLARYGLEGQLQREQDVARRNVSLLQPFADGLGLFEYRLALDVEGSAVLEAALGPLSAPRPAEDGPDLRGSDQRRADALVELVRRAVAAAAGMPVTPKAQLLLTMDFEALAGQVGAARTAAGLDAGCLLGPETVRRIACDAGIIPAVLDTEGEVLDWGRERRLFTPAQTRRLWLRDGGCSYPGCGIPGPWCDSHHLVHWADGGPSDLSNAALLCGHHHTVVHTRRLAGRLTTPRVGDPSKPHIEWELTRGSYDQLIAERAARDSA